jgi:hypothetical protein
MQPTIKKWLPRCAPQEDNHWDETCATPQNQKKIDLEDDFENK